jgi:hypothetical protein
MRLMRWVLAPAFAFLVLAASAGATNYDAAFAVPVRDAHTQPAHHPSLRLSGEQDATRHASARVTLNVVPHSVRSCVRRAYELAACMVALIPPGMRPRPPPQLDRLAA